ncbi:MAG TPA: hypothetical protein VF600_07750 [Abditibacteriaceae bacterium]|jgi:hypothetical protein
MASINAKEVTSHKSSGLLTRSALGVLAVTAGIALPVLTTQLSQVDAATSKVASAVATPQQRQRAQQVTSALTAFLRKRVKSPSGKLQLVVRPGARADIGQFSEIFIAGQPATVKKLRVTELAMRARNVRISVPELMKSENKSLETLSSQTSLRIVVTEKDLEGMFARGKSTRTMGLRVKYLQDRVQISGNVNYAMLNGPVIGTGRLRLAADHKVYLDILSLKLNGAEAPPFVKQRFSERINPLISYDELPFRPRFKSLKFVGNKAILTA